MDENLPSETELMEYLDNELSPAAKAALESRLQNEPDLRARLDSLRLTKSAVQLYGINDAVSKVRKQWEAGQKAQAPARIIRMSKPLRYALAAACILFLVIGIRLFWPSTLSNQQIFDKVYVDYNPSAFRSNDSSTSFIERAYINKNYQEVIRLASIHQDTASKARLLTGLAYLHLNNLRAATPVFRDLLTNADQNFHQDAEFYYGLTELKAGNDEEAYRILKKIHDDPRHLYHNQVSDKTLADLKRIH